MSDAEYREEMNDIEYNITLYKGVLEVLKQFLMGKLGKLKALDKSIDRILEASNSDIRGVNLNKALKILDDRKAFMVKSVSSYSVTKAIEDFFEERGSLSLNDGDVDEISVEAQKDLIETYRNCLYLLVNELDKLDNLRESQARGGSAEEKSVEEFQKPIIEEASISDDDFEEEFIATPNKENVPLIKGTLEEKKAGALEYLKNKINAGNVGELTPDEQKLLADGFSDQQYLLYNTFDLIEAGIKIQKIAEEFNKYQRTSSYLGPSLHSLYSLAELIYNNLPNELLNGLPTDSESRYSQDLINTVKVHESLETYKYCYDIYMRYYNNMSEEEKNAIKASFNQSFGVFKDTFKLDDFTIITPEELKNLVNQKVIEKMVEAKENYMIDKEFVSDNINYACSYMDEKEMVGIYKRVVSSLDNQELNSDKRKILQKNFALTILKKMNLKNLNAEEINAKLEQIMKEYLEEEMLFEISAEELLKYSKAQSNNNQSKFFGFDKLKQTLANMQNKLNKQTKQDDSTMRR